jgi:uncharacterized membrane protein
MSHDLFSNRKQFQLERMILFSDAVFAIAITLLVIEIKVPEGLNGDAGIWHLMGERSPEFFGLALSFAVIGQFWVNHHRIFGYVIDYTPRLLWLNLHLLFWIILMPFSSSLNSRYGNLNSVWTIYCFNMFMIGMAMYFILLYLLNPKRNLTSIAHEPLTRKTALARGFSIAMIFLLGLMIVQFEGYWAFLASRLVFFLIPVAIWFSKRLYRKTSVKKIIPQ